MIHEEIFIILMLIIFNGLLSAAEMSIVASRKSRLEALLEEGKKAAKLVIEIKESPDVFLSTVQIGITMIGLVTGIYSGSTVANELAGFFQNLGFSSEISMDIAFVAVVIIITYFTLIIGELVPKRIAIRNPEKVALFLIRPMRILKKVFYVFVKILGVSSNLIMKAIRLKDDSNSLSEDEIRSIIKEGKRLGVIDKMENEILQRAMVFSEVFAGEILTDISKAVWLDKNEGPASVKSKIAGKLHSYYLLCEGKVDNLLGIVYSKELIHDLLTGRTYPLNHYCKSVNEFNLKTNIETILSVFKSSGNHFGVVYSEQGTLRGIISLNNITDVLVQSSFGLETPNITETGKNEYLILGEIPLYEIKQYLELEHEIPEEPNYYTLRGLLLEKFNKIPEEGEEIVIGNYKFTIIEMDENRIEKVKAVLM